MKRFVLALPLAAIACCSCSQVSVQSLSTRVGETEFQPAVLATPTPVATPTAIPTAIPTAVPVAPAAPKKTGKKEIVIPTFPLPPLPKSKSDGPEFRAFAKGVLTQLTDGRNRVIAANHKIAGEYANAKELIYDSGLLKESVTSAKKTTVKNMVDCAKLSQYAKNALAAMQALPVKDINASAAADDIEQLLPDIAKAYLTLLLDLQAIKLNLDDLDQNANVANPQYLDDSVQSGLTALGKISDDVADLKSAMANFSGSLNNTTRN